MYYIIDNDPDERYDDADDVCEYLFDTDNYEDYDAADEWINEAYSGADVAGSYFEPADIVRELDNYLYSDLISEWARMQSENDWEYYHDDIEEMEIGDSMEINGYTVTACADNDDEDENEEEFDEFDSILQVTYTVNTVSNNPAPVQVVK